MHIFISWSGRRADVVARALNVFLLDSLNDVTTFISQDLDGGSRWSDQIDTHLDRADYGIVCLTKDRLRMPWINYEAGALGRAVTGGERKRVVPLLLDSNNPNDVPQPLSLFNVSLSSKADIFKLLREINELVERPTNVETVARRAEAAWPELLPALEAAKVEPEPPADSGQTPPTETTLTEKLDEILAFARQAKLSIPRQIFAAPPSTVVPERVFRTPVHELLSKFEPFGFKFLIADGVEDGYTTQIVAEVQPTMAPEDDAAIRPLITQEVEQYAVRTDGKFTFFWRELNGDTSPVIINGVQF